MDTAFRGKFPFGNMQMSPPARGRAEAQPEGQTEPGAGKQQGPGSSGGLREPG